MRNDNNSLRSLKIPDKLRDPFYFEEIINHKVRILDDYDAIDLSAVSFIEPYSLISLLLLGKTFLRERGEKLILVNIPVNIHQYLIRMDFFKNGIIETCEILNEKYFLKRSSFSSRVIEIIEIPNKERESLRVIAKVITVFRKRASHILKHWLSDEITDYFVTVISEICQNIFEHSLESGFLAMQTYSTGRDNIVRLVISDSGIGIRKSFENKNSIDYSSSAELIEKALKTPISSKRTYGYGLCQVNSIVDKLKGTVYIRSGDASVTVLYQKKKDGHPYTFLKNDLAYFDGTQISISLSGKG